ncbi:BioY protein [Roseomonas mucosa]|uniref:biotin transporter BioY n=1 Tax=Roseomonas TaxID=125216 RepID=UPI000C19D64A|nr:MULTISPECIES: biotin transporter BioY [Roseomonas]ATR22638.1 BioY protein [Roseomonas sp. FDAARGOS_362]UZO98610.1 BioY protein [Roseomonas mucosa]
MNALLTQARSRGGLLSFARFLGLALIGSGILAASAQVTVPMWPVPATLQSLAVLLLGALGGSRLGAASVALYLAEGAMGLPVFAGGATGLTTFAGPTAGYLLGFLPAAWIAGQASGSWLRGALVLTVAHLALFVPGVAWLAGFAGWEKALMAGFVLFIPGTLVKTGLAFAALRLARRQG